MKVIWKDIVGFDGRYRVSNNGIVVDSKTEAEIQKTNNVVTLKKENNQYYVYNVDVLVDTYFPTDKPKEYIVIDGVKYNSYDEAALSLNLKITTIKKRVSSLKYTEYNTCIE